MTTDNLYKSIAERTGGDIYIGVVGPVRSGKSPASASPICANAPSTSFRRRPPEK